MSIFDICRKNKGSISIMLCMLLLPMVTYASMIIDASRLQSAKVAVSGAGDLTMNASLSEYEQTLHDIYGLFAMVQDEDDLEPALQDYFKRTIEKGLSGTGTDDQTIQNYAKAMSDWVLGMGDSDELDFDNFLNMEVESVSTEGVESSALANPAVLERQIIDYMKYRGPVSLVSTVFSKLSFLKNSSAQTEVIENKVKYTESLSELQDPCEAAYAAISGKGEGSNHENGYNDYAKNVNGTKFSDVVTKAKKYYIFASESILFRTKTPITNNKPYVDGNNLGELNTDGASRSWKTVEQIKNENSGLDFDNINQKSLAYDDAKRILQTVYDESCKIINTSNSGETKYCNGNITYHKEYNAEEEEKSVVNATINQDTSVFTSEGSIRNMFYKLHSVWDKVNIVGGNDWYIDSVKYESSNPDGEFMYDISSRYTLQRDIMNNFDSLIQMKVYLDDYQNLSNLFNDLWSAYSSDIEEKDPTLYDTYKEASYCVQKVRESLYPASVGSVKSYSSWISTLLYEVADNNIYNAAAEYFEKKAWSALDDYYQIVCNTYSKISETITALTSIQSSMESVKTAKKNWENSINAVDTGSTKAGMKTDYETTTDGLNEEDIVNLKKVAESFQTDVNAYKTKLEGITFIDTKLLGVDKAPDFLYNSYYDNYKDDSREIISIAQGIVDDKLATDTIEEVVFKYIDGYADNEKTTLDDKEKFYLTLKSICEAKDSKKGVNDEQQGKVDAVNDMVANEDSVNLNKDEDTSQNHGVTSEEAKKLGEILKSIADYRGEADVPQTEAPDTGKSKNVKIDTSSEDFSGQGDNAKNALSKAKELLKEICKIGDSVRDYAYLEEYFTEMYSCDTDRISLVGKDNEVVNLNGAKLNSDTAWYGKEIEFILWGNSNPDTNLTSNYAMIYMIRFALNAIYAFTAPDIQSFALSTATAIAGWTVIGVPIVQAVITIGLALAESGVDIAMLKAGEDVVIYKSATTFVCSPSGLVSEGAKTIVEKVVKKAADTAASAASKIIDDAVDGLKGTIKENKDKINKAVNQYVEKQTEALTSSVMNMFVTPILNKITPIMNEVNGDVNQIQNRVNDAVDSAFETIKSNIEANSSGALKDIALKSYDAIIKDNEAITNLKNKINEYFKKASDVTSTETLESIVNAQVKSWGSKISEYVTGYTSKLLDDLNAEIDKHVDDAATSVKGIINEKTSEFADTLSDTLTSEMDGLATRVNDSSLTDSKDTLSASGGVTLNYKEYCKIFVFLEIIGNKDAMLNRAAALMEANVQAKDNSNFKITKAYTLMHINADIKMKTLFSWGVEAEQNDAEGSTGYSFSVGNMSGDSVTLKYDGINGY